MAKFTTYRTYYDIYSEVAPKGARRSPKEYYVEALDVIAKTIIDPEKTLRPRCPNDEIFDLHMSRREDWPLFFSTHESELDWYYTSRPTFKIFPGMVDALAHTSIDVVCEHIHLPFPTFQIDLPADNKLGEEHGGPGYDGLLVTTSDIINFEDMEGGQGLKLCIFATRRDRGGEAYGDLGYKNYNRILAGTGTFPLTNNHSLFALPIIDESMTVTELLAKYDEQMVEHDKGFGERLARRRLLSLVIATILIAVSNDKRLIKPETRGIKHRLKGDKARRRGDKSAGLANKGFLVGADINLPKDLRQAINEPAGTVGSQLNYGHIRSGHLRVQPYGKKGEKKSYKVIFIAPSFIRPDLPLKPKLTDRVVKGV